MNITIDNKTYIPYAVKINDITILKCISKDGEIIILDKLLEVNNELWKNKNLYK